MTADPNLLSVPSSLQNLLTMLDSHKAENIHVLIGDSQQTLSSTASQRLGKPLHHLHCTSGETCTNAVQADLEMIARKELAVHNYLQKNAQASSIAGCHNACKAVCSCVIASVNL